MTSHRFALVLAAPVALAGLITMAACSSSSGGDTGPGTGPSGCPADPFGTTGLDTVKTDRLTFCNGYVSAITTKATALGCALQTTPTCPKVMDDFEATLSVPACQVVGYSQGTLTNCECRIAAYTTCDDFASKPCVFGALVDSSACGSDSGVDGSEDALPDTSAADSPTDSGDAGGGD